MLVTVVIPCYNSSSTIRRALESVLSQSFVDFEVIIIDDGSEDINETIKIISGYNDSRIRMIRHAVNMNGAVARNTGINNSKGEFIAFLDADDEWTSDHLFACTDKMKVIDIKTVLYCQSLIKKNGFSDLIMPLRGIQKKEKISDYLFINSGFISTPSLFAHRSVFNEVLFNVDLKRHQDYDLLLKLESNSCSFAFLERVGVIVHWENTNTDSKGATWQYSLSWALSCKQKISPKSFKYFVLKNCVIKLFQKKERLKGCEIFIKHALLLYPIKNWYIIFSFFLFGKIVFFKIKK